MKGFTLIEIVMAIAVTGVLVAAMGIFSKYMVIDTYQFIHFRDDIVTSARTGLRMMSREIRNIKDEESILIATPNELKFTDVKDNAVSYKLAGNNLMRNNDILCASTTALKFSYFDRDGQELSSPMISPSTTDIWLVDVKMLVARGDQEDEMHIVLRPRNFTRQSP